MLQPADVAVFGPLKKRLTAALSHLNQAQLLQIQKFERLEAYIQARTGVFDHSHIRAVWRGAGLIPFDPQRALCTIENSPTPKLERPKTPTQSDIFDQVFVNSSPPDAAILQAANELLNTSITAHTIPSTPVCQYIQKLTVGTEQLRARSILHQHDANNLRSIIKQRTTLKKGKRVILKGQFCISTQKLCDAVVAAEKATKKQEEKKSKITAKVRLYEAENEEEVEKQGQDESESEIGECIVVDVE